jgi:hypothetical protein
VGENGPVILPKLHRFTPFRDILHAENLRYGANGFTSLPKEGMPKNPTASAGSELAILGTRGQHANRWTTEAAILQAILHIYVQQADIQNREERHKLSIQRAHRKETIQEICQ